MDAGSSSSSSASSSRFGHPYSPPDRNPASRNRSRFAHPYFPANRNPTTPHSRRRRHNADRFIPSRSAMDFAYANYQLTHRSARDEEEEESLYAAAPDSYRKLLAKALGIDRSRILSFRNKPSEHRELLLEMQPRLKPQTYIPKNLEETVNAPDLIDGLCLNLLDWGSKNVLSLALGDTVHFWNGWDGCVSELVTVDQETGPVTSVSWAGHRMSSALHLDWILPMPSSAIRAVIAC